MSSPSFSSSARSEPSLQSRRICFLKLRCVELFVASPKPEFSSEVVRGRHRCKPQAAGKMVRDRLAAQTGDTEEKSGGACNGACNGGASAAAAGYDGYTPGYKDGYAAGHAAALRSMNLAPMTITPPSPPSSPPSSQPSQPLAPPSPPPSPAEAEAAPAPRRRSSVMLRELVPRHPRRTRGKPQ